MTRLHGDDFYQRARAALHALSVDGEICSVRKYDELRPPELPKAGGLVTRLGLNYWRQVAVWAGLTMSPARAGNHKDTELLPPHKRDPRSIVTAASPQPGIALVRGYIRRER